MPPGWGCVIIAEPRQAGGAASTFLLSRGFKLFFLFLKKYSAANLEETVRTVNPVRGEMAPGSTQDILLKPQRRQSDRSQFFSIVSCAQALQTRCAMLLAGVAQGLLTA